MSWLAINGSILLVSNTVIAFLCPPVLPLFLAMSLIALWADYHRI